MSFIRRGYHLLVTSEVSLSKTTGRSQQHKQIENDLYSRKLDQLIE